MSFVIYSLQFDIFENNWLIFYLVLIPRDQVVPSDIVESWIGLNYNKVDQTWFWADGNEDMVSTS